jgi:hypothetical protein
MKIDTRVCKKCKNEVNIKFFLNKTKNKEYTRCFNCREKSRLWREKNKERISTYNKYKNMKNKIGKKIVVVYSRKKGDDEWIKFKSQSEASEKLGLYKSNINKVIKGFLKTTGGYEFKIESENIDIVLEKNWNDIKKEKNYSSGLNRSSNRINHTQVNGIQGKRCCTCKNWEPLIKFNNSKSHWDGLRNDCKKCIKTYREKNKERIRKCMSKYEKNRKKTDPEFKLMKTLRSRLGSALNRVKLNKTYGTIELTGCTVSELKKHIEKQFNNEMTWENHGIYWHLDHIIPYSAFDLTKKTEQFVCFNYRNLQPLECIVNLTKSNKYNIKDKKQLYKKVIL